ncbi:MAG: R3H domain-containing nucleic acid-binding protein [Anaerolineae bacterium]|jgi:stage III sporulation protein SpoIIIAA|nr:R3H domain-containing nucleic acid-binding protein [Anaerolineae bacterium]
MSKQRITDNLEELLSLLPEEYRSTIKQGNHEHELIEIIMDLGRVPFARYVDGETQLSEKEVTPELIQSVVERTGEFDDDNRAGIERTLHRISCIRSRRGHIVGLTCRVGRAVYGTLDIIQDLVESGKSVLILGAPGVGKTTLLREAARVLAETKRVVIVDTSNEIGGDGDVPHPAVGRSRRMQVAKPTLQHEVMIEAVENHNPEVIIIDEIGRELEAAAARTIAERGVQLIGTAHGRTLDNLMLNPTLSDLIGGIESVTLSDEEARRRGTQKTVLERRSPPTFDILIEIARRDHLIVHADVATAVDELVRGYPLQPELRRRKEDGSIVKEKTRIAPSEGSRTQGFSRNTASRPEPQAGTQSNRQMAQSLEEIPVRTPGVSKNKKAEGKSALKPVHIYAYGVARNRLMQAAQQLGVPALVTRHVEEADVFITLRSYYRSRQQVVMDAETNGMPIYILRSNTTAQMEKALVEMFNLSYVDYTLPTEEDLMRMTEDAIKSVLNGESWVDLPPAPANVRRMQHEMARQAELVSHSYGKEPNRRVRIFRN